MKRTYVTDETELQDEGFFHEWVTEMISLESKDQTEGYGNVGDCLTPKYCILIKAEECAMQQGEFGL